MWILWLQVIDMVTRDERKLMVSLMAANDGRFEVVLLQQICLDLLSGD
jgi:hypothetical protein